MVLTCVLGRVSGVAVVTLLTLHRPTLTLPSSLGVAPECAPHRLVLAIGGRPLWGSQDKDSK